MDSVRAAVVAFGTRARRFLLHPRQWFPLACGVLYVVAISLRLHGSSISKIWRDYTATEDPALIVGVPRAIRSDEWMVTLPKLFTQVHTNYAPINPLLGRGEDVRLFVDVPFDGWAHIFRPLNWAFEILPVEFAYSARWWWYCFALLIAAYYFVLLLLPRLYAVAALGAITITLTPLLMWWFGGTSGFFAYTFFVMICADKILRTSSKLMTAACAVGIFYFGMCLAMLMYPPFVIAVAYGSAAFMLGHILEHRHHMRGRIWLKAAAIVGPAICAGFVFVLFMNQSAPAVDAALQSAYPGNRIIPSGQMNSVRVVSAYFDYFLQDPKTSFSTKAWWLQENRSEASGFFFVSLLVLPLAGFVAWKTWRRFKVIHWTLVFPLLMMAALLCWNCIPGLPGWVGAATLLNRIPPNRLLIGLALLNYVLFFSSLRIWLTSLVRVSPRVIVGYTLMWVGITGLHLYLVKSTVRGYVTWTLLAVFLLCIGSFVYLVVSKRIISAMGVLAAFSLWSVISVHPLVMGLSSVQKLPIAQRVAQLPGGDSAAFAGDVLELEGIPNAMGRRSLTGVYTYPQPEIWRSFVGTRDEKIYNRYAHAMFEFVPGLSLEERRIRLKTEDVFVISINPCDPKLAEFGVRYLISSKSQLNHSSSCLTLVDNYRTNTGSVTIYEIEKNLTADHIPAVKNPK